MPKQLTRNPLAQWQRLVDMNIECMLATDSLNVAIPKFRDKSFSSLQRKGRQCRCEQSTITKSVDCGESSDKATNSNSPEPVERGKDADTPSINIQTHFSSNTFTSDKAHATSMENDSEAQITDQDCQGEGKFFDAENPQGIDSNDFPTLSEQIFKQAEPKLSNQYAPNWCENNTEECETKRNRTNQSQQCQSASNGPDCSAISASNIIWHAICGDAVPAAAIVDRSSHEESDVVTPNHSASETPIRGKSKKILSNGKFKDFTHLKKFKSNNSQEGNEICPPYHRDEISDWHQEKRKMSIEKEFQNSLSDFSSMSSKDIVENLANQQFQTRHDSSTSKAQSLRTISPSEYGDEDSVESDRNSVYSSTSMSSLDISLQENETESYYHSQLNRQQYEIGYQVGDSGLQMESVSPVQGRETKREISRQMGHPSFNNSISVKKAEINTDSSKSYPRGKKLLSRESKNKTPSGNESNRILSENSDIAYFYPVSQQEIIDFNQEKYTFKYFIQNSAKVSMIVHNEEDHMATTAETIHTDEILDNKVSFDCYCLSPERVGTNCANGNGENEDQNDLDEQFHRNSAETYQQNKQLFLDNSVSTSDFEIKSTLPDPTGETVNDWRLFDAPEQNHQWEECKTFKEQTSTEQVYGLNHSATQTTQTLFPNNTAICCYLGNLKTDFPRKRAACIEITSPPHQEMGAVCLGTCISSDPSSDENKFHRKPPKQLTRNSLTQWKHLVDVNMNALAGNNRSCSFKPDQCEWQVSVDMLRNNHAKVPHKSISENGRNEGDGGDCKDTFFEVPVKNNFINEEKISHEVCRTIHESKRTVADIYHNDNIVQTTGSQNKYGGDAAPSCPNAGSVQIEQSKDISNGCLNVQGNIASEKGMSERETRIVSEMDISENETEIVSETGAIESTAEIVSGTGISESGMKIVSETDTPERAMKIGPEMDISEGGMKIISKNEMVSISEADTSGTTDAHFQSIFYLRINHGGTTVSSSNKYVNVDATGDTSEIDFQRPDCPMCENVNHSGSSQDRFLREAVRCHIHERNESGGHNHMTSLLESLPNNVYNHEYPNNVTSLTESMNGEKFMEGLTHGNSKHASDERFHDTHLSHGCCQTTTGHSEQNHVSKTLKPSEAKDICGKQKRQSPKLNMPCKRISLEQNSGCINGRPDTNILQQTSHSEHLFTKEVCDQDFEIRNEFMNETLKQLPRRRSVACSDNAPRVRSLETYPSKITIYRSQKRRMSCSQYSIGKDIFIFRNLFGHQDLHVTMNKENTPKRGGISRRWRETSGSKLLRAKDILKSDMLQEDFSYNTQIMEKYNPVTCLQPAVSKNSMNDNRDIKSLDDEKINVHDSHLSRLRYSAFSQAGEKIDIIQRTDSKTTDPSFNTRGKGTKNDSDFHLERRSDSGRTDVEQNENKCLTYLNKHHPELFLENSRGDTSWKGQFDEPGGHGDVTDIDSRHLTRNPLRQWRHLVDTNIGLLARYKPRLVCNGGNDSDAYRQIYNQEDRQKNTVKKYGNFLSDPSQNPGSENRATDMGTFRIDEINKHNGRSNEILSGTMIEETNLKQQDSPCQTFHDLGGCDLTTSESRNDCDLTNCEIRNECDLIISEIKNDCDLTISEIRNEYDPTISEARNVCGPTTSEIRSECDLTTNVIRCKCALATTESSSECDLTASEIRSECDLSTSETRDECDLTTIEVRSDCAFTTTSVSEIRSEDDLTTSETSGECALTTTEVRSECALTTTSASEIRSEGDLTTSETRSECDLTNGQICGYCISAKTVNLSATDKTLYNRRRFCHSHANTKRNRSLWSSDIHNKNAELSVMWDSNETLYSYQTTAIHENAIEQSNEESRPSDAVKNTDSLAMGSVDHVYGTDANEKYLDRRPICSDSCCETCRSIYTDSSHIGPEMNMERGRHQINQNETQHETNEVYHLDRDNDAGHLHEAGTDKPTCAIPLTDINSELQKFSKNSATKTASCYDNRINPADIQCLIYPRDKEIDVHKICTQKNDVYKLYSEVMGHKIKQILSQNKITNICQKGTWGDRYRTFQVEKGCDVNEVHQTDLKNKLYETHKTIADAEISQSYQSGTPKTESSQWSAASKKDVAADLDSQNLNVDSSHLATSEEQKNCHRLRKNQEVSDRMDTMTGSDIIGHDGENSQQQDMISKGKVASEAPLIKTCTTILGVPNPMKIEETVYTTAEFPVAKSGSGRRKERRRAAAEKAEKNMSDACKERPILEIDESDNKCTNLAHYIENASTSTERLFTVDSIHEEPLQMSPAKRHTDTSTLYAVRTNNTQKKKSNTSGGTEQPALQNQTKTSPSSSWARFHNWVSGLFGHFTKAERLAETYECVVKSPPQLSSESRNGHCQNHSVTSICGVNNHIILQKTEACMLDAVDRGLTLTNGAIGINCTHLTSESSSQAALNTENLTLSCASANKLNDPQEVSKIFLHNKQIRENAICQTGTPKRVVFGKEEYTYSKDSKLHRQQIKIKKPSLIFKPPTRKISYTKVPKSTGLRKHRTRTGTVDRKYISRLRSDNMRIGCSPAYLDNLTGYGWVISPISNGHMTDSKREVKYNTAVDQEKEEREYVLPDCDDRINAPLVDCKSTGVTNMNSDDSSDDVVFSYDNDDTVNTVTFADEPSTAQEICSVNTANALNETLLNEFCKKSEPMSKYAHLPRTVVIPGEALKIHTIPIAVQPKASEFIPVEMIGLHLSTKTETPDDATSEMNGAEPVISDTKDLVTSFHVEATKQFTDQKELNADNPAKNDILQFSLECLLEMLVQRGKVHQAFVTNAEGDVVAKTLGLEVIQKDSKTLLSTLKSNYTSAVRMQIFNDIYTCFKYQNDCALVGRSSKDIFVARRGQQSMVVGFADLSTPGSCIKEIQELSHALCQRGL